MAQSHNLRGWLRQLPEPVAFMLDGSVRVALTKGAHRFATAEETIRQRDPETVDALDKDGSVIRTFACAKPEPERAPIAVPEPDTSEQKTLIHFASLLSQAYAQGAKDHSAAYKETFEQVVSLANQALQRVQGLEKLLNQMLRDVREDALAAREELDEAREARREAEAPRPGSGGGAKSIVEEMVKRRMADAVASKVAGGEPDASKTGGA